MMIMTMLAVIIIVLPRIINNVLTSSYHCNPPHKQTTVKDNSTTYIFFHNFNVLYPHILHIVCVNLMQKYTRIVILIHRMTSQDDWWSFSLQIEMFSIVTFKFPDWIVLICSRTYRWWSSCKVMRVVSYRLPWSPLPLASLSSLPFCENYSWGHHILSKIWNFVICCLNTTSTSVDSVSKLYFLCRVGSGCLCVVRLVRCVQHYLSTIWILTPRHTATPWLRFTHQAVTE